MLDNEQLRPVCYNNRKGPASGYWTQERVYEGAGPYKIENVFIPFRLKQGCGQDGSHKPCIGCKHLETV